MPPICRFNKAPLPDSTAAFCCISLGGKEATLRVGLEVQRPAFLHEPFIKSDIHVLDTADAYPPVTMDFINSLVVAPNGAVGNPFDRRITRRETALPLLALFI
jgi:hypothetical protein